MIYFSKARDWKNTNMNILHYAKQRGRQYTVDDMNGT